MDHRTVRPPPPTTVTRSRRHRALTRTYLIFGDCKINGASLCQVDLVGLVVSVLTGSGCDLSEESVVGVEPAALDVGVAPWCPPGPVSVSGCASRMRRR